MSIANQLEIAYEEIHSLRDEADEMACQLSEAQEDATDLYKILLQAKNLLKGGNPEVALVVIEEALEYEYEGVDMDA
ncbi:hypothetical protein M3611_26575 [Priestia megaterium]|uniref:hypothetical protein n=1 Tax=Priestia megaterium TaxID=1404 RepID=UPI00203EC161|nr:hypothetical protein [Priestia megaterium]MCM3155562.1 hypothetical protein [Priestia megaterium]